MCDEDLINLNSPSGSSPRQSKFCEPLIRPVKSSSLNLGTNPFDEVEQASRCLDMDDPFDFNFLKKITDSVEPVDEISNDNVIIKQHHKSEGTLSAAMCSELLEECHYKIKDQTDSIPQNVMKLPSNICLEELTLDSNVDQSFLINRFLNDNIQCKDSHRRSFSCGGSIGMNKYTITAELQEVSSETTTSNNTFNTAFVESNYSNGSSTNPYHMSRIRSASNSLSSAVFAKSSRESESANEHLFSMGSGSTFNTNNSLNLGFIAETSKDSYKHPICSWSSPPSCGAISLSDHNMLAPLSNLVIADTSVGEYPSVFYEDVDQDQRILKEANDVVSKINHLRRISACSEEDIMLQELDYHHTPSLESDTLIIENKSTGELPNCLGNKDTKSKSTVNADERSQFPSMEYDDFLLELKQISEETKSTKLADFVNKIMKTNSPVMSKIKFDKQELRGSEYPKARPRSYSVSTGIAKIKKNTVHRPNGNGPGVHTLQVPVGGKLRDRSASCTNKRSSGIGPVKAFLPFVKTKGQAIASSTPTYTRKGHDLKASSTPHQVLNVTKLTQFTRQNSFVFGSTCSSIPHIRERSASVSNVSELRIKDGRHVPSKESPKEETGDRKGTKLYTPVAKYTQKGHIPKASSTPRLVMDVNKLTPLTRHNSLVGSTYSSTPFMRERSVSATRVSEVRIKGRWSMSSKESPKEETGGKKGTKLYKPLAKIFGKVRGSNKENSSSSQ